MPAGTPALLVRHAPDGIGAVVGNVERSFAANCYADWTAPNFAVLCYEAGEEIVVLAGCFTVWRGNENYFVASPLGAIPRAVFGGENVATKFLRELRSS